MTLVSNLLTGVTAIYFWKLINEIGNVKIQLFLIIKGKVRNIKRRLLNDVANQMIFGRKFQSLQNEEFR